MGSDDNNLESEIAAARARLQELESQAAEARERLQLLELQRSRPDTTRPKNRLVQPVPRTPQEKVELFRSLFRGRTDVFPKFWENPRTQKRGYSPACANEWVQGVCDKPRVKCGECPNQAFVEVDDRVIVDHLQGRHIAGVYPMLEDDSCWFIAADFDKDGWADDITAFAETCHDAEVPVALECSRSGNGGHAWLFFDAPVPAATARQMACYLLTKTMSRRHELPMSSYDRLFPNQDTIPRGGFGNLIALPLQRAARQRGNTVFLDPQLEPIKDQWSYLASHGKLSRLRVEELAREGLSSGQVLGVRRAAVLDEDQDVPWLRSPSRTIAPPAIDDPLPKSILVVSAQQLFVRKDELPAALLNQIKRLAAFQNPDFYKKQAMRLPTSLTPRVISCAEDLPDYIGIPRGCLNTLRDLLKTLGVTLEVLDESVEGEAIDVDFHGTLTASQQKAATALLAHRTGVFVAPPGTGKTVVGTNVIASRGRNTLVLVHRTQLLDQWRAQLSVFLDIDPKEIGQIGGGKNKPNGRLDVAMIQSLVRQEAVRDLVAWYGHVVVDECHHTPAVSFERVMREVKARYVTGLTATPQRRDGHHPILEMQLGPTRYSIAPKSLAASRPFDHRLIVRHTDFQLRAETERPLIQEVYSQLAADQVRNEMILGDVIEVLDRGRSPLLLTERKDHLEFFEQRLTGVARNLIVLQGGMRQRQRREVLARLNEIPDDEERLILATGRFIGEGFDDARLDTLFLALPVSWKGTLVQYAGRLHRRHQAKSEVLIFDYVDRNVTMLGRMFDKRMRGYRSMGYRTTGFERADGGADEYVIEYDPGALEGDDHASVI
ncbi:MAG: DEAD/DEAH box helicase family protein [Myxococcota bacterium]